MNRTWLRAVASVLFFTSSHAEAQSVVRVFGATSDAYDAAGGNDALWVATSGGLVNMQGERVVNTLTTRDGLPGTRVRSVSITDDGVWSGGVDGLAYVANARVVHTWPLLPRVTRVVQWEGALWIGTADRGVWRMASVLDVPLPVHLGRGVEHVTDLLVHSDSLYVSTAGAGIVRVNRQGRMVTHWRAAQGLPDDVVWDLEPEGDHIVLGTLAGVAVLRAGVITRDPLTDALTVPDVRAVHVDGGSLWLATFGAGVWHTTRGRAQLQRIDGSVMRARALASMGERVVVVHDEGVLSLAVTGRDPHTLLTGGLPSGDVTCLAQAFGAVWVGTFEHGLARIEGEHARAEETATTRWHIDARINDLAVTHGADGEHLWIATDRGVYDHDGRSVVPVLDTASPGREHTSALAIDPNTGDLWSVGSQTVARRHAGQWRAWHGDAAMGVVQLDAVAVDAHGHVWLGGLHGLFAFDPDTGEFQRHSTASGALPVDWVTAIVPWREGVVVGTYHGGLSWYDGTHFTVERAGVGGVPDGWVNPHAMRVIDGALWFGTLDRGLVHGTRGAWHAMGERNGLPANDVTAVLPAGDPAHVWIATRGGVVDVQLRPRGAVGPEHE